MKALEAPLMYGTVYPLIFCHARFSEATSDWKLISQLPEADE